MSSHRIAANDLLSLMAKTIEAGASVANILEQLELPSNLLEEPEHLVDMGDAWRIMLASQNAVHEESHLISSRPLRRGSTRLVFSSLQQCETLEEGLQSLAENYNIIHGGQFNFVRKQGRSLSYCVDDSEFHYQTQAIPLAIEFALISIHCTLSYLCKQALTLKRVCSKREQLPKHNHHLNIFRAPLKLQHAHYELAYDIEQARLPLLHEPKEDISANLYRHYEYFLSLSEANTEPSFVQICQEKINLASAKHVLVSQDWIASELNISVATLRRRLNEQGSNFRQLLDSSNSALACQYLQAGLGISDTAVRLGYSDERSFKRAFKRWHELSPAAYIKQFSHLK
ncbi:AraC family transcriptional regulator [Pseudoteredinibacter isoporae]|uniref:AraC-like DNA-binding protein n=1 Tax=Pseudoteredinibacter isoporae TaxID=570281 RepID=A0A7X0JVM5_9GAMM|nr:helix-turn-helix domain-containing protein [Pseudoteredinibacter isoporae]MBB6523012.1 AraC-like DNA-binding protein [Pseudoteredinibacter isoporae]NHO88534.1 AraC family transcriptional regulator [Pseudoteredinibacter isoporae]NIB22775.1 AraC family transcriptional regulator [Pseudoteredinibacter isoporae]